MSLTYFLIAFASGAIGTLIGGTQTFIITGVVGVIAAILQALGHDVTFFNDQVLNLLFLPAVIFNGAVVGTAYAAKKYEIRGFETGRSLVFTSDSAVFLIGGIGGLLGYSIYLLAVKLNMPLDQGSLSVIIVGILTRLIFNQEQTYNRRGIAFLQERNVKYWTYLILFSAVLAAIVGYFTEKTHLYTIGFSISAMTLIFGFTDKYFPATHHLTLVAGYAMMYTHNIILAILFGILAEALCDIFARVFNTECGTHIDPPAFAILICSFIIFILFK